MKNYSKKSKILFGAIVVCAFFLSIGATYAYFSLVVKGNNTANNTVVTSGSLEITYAETNTITASNILPGWSSSEKIVTITNTGTQNATYSLLWDTLSNEFTNNELLMSLACTSTGSACSGKDIPVTVSGTTYTYGNNAVILSSGSNINIQTDFNIEPETIQTLTLKFYFLETGENQNYNQGKTFTGKLKVGEKDTTFRMAYLLLTDDNVILTNGSEYRYTGANPNNYISFNNETWRIIGEFDGQYKIIKDVSIGQLAYDDDTNDWENSTLYEYLNNEYYNNLASNAKELIDESIWYTGTTNYALPVDEIYQNERSGININGYSATVNGNVGIMNLSDYGYAASGVDYSSISTYYYNDENIMENNWLLPPSSQEWTLTPPAENNAWYYEVQIWESGKADITFGYTVKENSVRPVVYLIPGVKLEGSGTSINPFTIVEN